MNGERKKWWSGRITFYDMISGFQITGRVKGVNRIKIEKKERPQGGSGDFKL